MILTCAKFYGLSLNSFRFRAPPRFSKRLEYPGVSRVNSPSKPSVIQSNNAYNKSKEMFTLHDKAKFEVRSQEFTQKFAEVNLLILSRVSVLLDITSFFRKNASTHLAITYSPYRIQKHS